MMKRIFLTLLVVSSAGIGMGQEVKYIPKDGQEGVPRRTLKKKSGLTWFPIVVDGKPLCIVDGIIRNEVDWLDKSDIESMTVLRPFVATAIYGNKGVNGAILFTTKSQLLTICDSISGRAIPFAIIEVRGGEKEFSVQSDKDGKVRLRRLKPDEDYRVSVSSVGYRQASFYLDASHNNTPLNIYLSRDIRTCPEVVVKATSSTRISCSIRCFMGNYRCDINKDEKKANKKHRSISLFPNPAVRGTSFSIAFEGESTGELHIEMTDMNGRRVFQQRYQAVKGRNIFSLPAKRDWAAGIYFVNILFKDGRMKEVATIVID